MLSRTKLSSRLFSANPMTVSWNVINILVGSFLVALAMNIFYIPSKFVSGGLTGLAVIVYYTLGIKPSLTLIILNFPLLLLGYLMLKHPANLFYTLVGFTSNAFFLELTRSMGSCLFIPDDIIRAIFGGIVVGTGSGIIWRKYGSMGGTDIIGMILRERFGLKIGMVNLLFNFLIMGGSAFIFEPYKAMYSILASYFACSMADRVIVGFENRKAIFIFSDKAVALVQLISQTTGYRAILIPRIELASQDLGEGSNYRYIIYTLATANRVTKIRAVTQEIDPDAFISISEVSEIMGLWNNASAKR